ncbi:hypothetical protein [Aquaspirillum sp. LM1]|uniref:hypothetical protein n=1 Tax=Aquaspirillum sp. LM1 TaxID=1938604 RepID=UPI001237736E|nr:hypothetical protein [Aquaspirillum sp. LM1]
MNNLKNNAITWPCDSKGLFVYRGFGRERAEHVIEISSPKNRHPRDTPLDVQIQVDNWLEQRFGYRFRESSLFVTGDYMNATNYAQHGEVRVIQPLSDYVFCWSRKCCDLYGEVELSPQSESIPDMMERLEFQCTDIYNAIKSGNEIMIICDRLKASKIEI